MKSHSGVELGGGLIHHRVELSRNLSRAERATVNSRVSTTVALKVGNELRDPRDRPTVAARINNAMHSLSGWGSLISLVGFIVAIAHGHPEAMQDWGIALAANVVVFGITAYASKKLKERVKHVTREELVTACMKGVTSTPVLKKLSDTSGTSWGMVLWFSMRIAVLVLGAIFVAHLSSMHSWQDVSQYFENAANATCAALIFVLFFASRELRRHIESLNPDEAMAVLDKMDQDLGQIKEEGEGEAIAQARDNIASMRIEADAAKASPHTFDGHSISLAEIREGMEGLSDEARAEYLDRLDQHLDEMEAQNLGNKKTIDISRGNIRFVRLFLNDHYQC